MNKSIFIFSLVSIALLTGCNAKPPTSQDPTIKEEMDNAASTSPEAHLLEFMAETRKSEAPYLKGYEAQIRREGNILTLYSDHAPVARFTDDYSYQWVLAGHFKTKDKQTYFIIRKIKLETDSTSYNLVIDSDGKPIVWLLDNVLISDGPILASGLGGSLDLGGPQIVDWSQEPKLKFEFNSPCDPVKWLNAKTIEAKCTEEESSITSEALITQESPRQWRLVEKPGSYSKFKAEMISEKAQIRQPFDESIFSEPIKPLDENALIALRKSGFNDFRDAEIEP